MDRHKVGNKVGGCSCVGEEELREEKSLFVNVLLLCFTVKEFNHVHYISDVDPSSPV